MESIRFDTGIREVDSVKILDVVGEIDVYTAPRFKEAVNTIIAAGQMHLIVNMAGVTYMDSSGFATLLSATRRLRPQGGTVNLVQCASAIDRILRITRLNTVFGIYDSVDDAVKATKSA